MDSDTSWTFPSRRESAISPIADRRLYAVDGNAEYKAIDPIIGGTVTFGIIEENWDDTLRLAASIKAENIAPSLLMRRLTAYPRQNVLAKTLSEIGRLERTLFTLDWTANPVLRRSANAGFDKGEARGTLARAIFFPTIRGNSRPSLRKPAVPRLWLQPRCRRRHPLEYHLSRLRRVRAALALRAIDPGGAPARIRVAAEASADDVLREVLASASEGEIDDTTLLRANARRARRCSLKQRYARDEGVPLRRPAWRRGPIENRSRRLRCRRRRASLRRSSPTPRRARPRS